MARYDNRRVLLATHMRALLTSSSMTKPSSSKLKRLLSVVNSATRSFRAMGRPVEHWDDWLVHLVSERLDTATRLLWESSRTSNQEFPTWEELRTFLLTRAMALDASCPPVASSSPGAVNGYRSSRKEEVASHAAAARGSDWCAPCSLCRERHSLRACERFKTLAVERRRDQLRKDNACFNCLSQGHMARAYPSSNRCRQCNEKHHSLLHPTNPETDTRHTPQSSSPNQVEATEPTGAATTTKVASLSSTTSATVLLATARVRLLSEAGHSMEVRAFLDSGSGASFITERAAQQLRLSRQRVSVHVSGLQGVSAGRASQSVTLMIGSLQAPGFRIALPRVGNTEAHRAHPGTSDPRYLVACTRASIGGS